MSVADEIQRLQQLHISGALTDAEFADAKAAVLAGASSERQRSGDGAVCYKCAEGPRGVCQLCGHMFCDQHGGERLVWVDSTGGKHGARNTLTKRVICDDCTTDQALMKRRLTFLVTLFIVVGASIFLVGLFILLSFFRF